MTDEEIRDVFAELHRVGADLARPPGLALGTGFRDGELLTWLRSLPAELGHDTFLVQLNEKVNAAQPNNAAALPGGADGRPSRMWPTVEQMHAAVDVLVREWDPLGARLGELSSEDVTHHAYNALGNVLRGGDSESIERRISATLGSIGQEVFGVRPSPRVQRRYLARRLIQVVVDQPGPPHEEDLFEVVSRAAAASMEIARAEGRVRETRTKTGSSATVCFGPRGDEPPALGPDALCTECGTTGTVAVVGREVEPRISRYCPTCWSKVREQYVGRYWRRRSKPEEETTAEGLIAALDRHRDEMLFHARERVRFTLSAMWEDRLPFIEASLTPQDDTSTDDRQRQLQHLARELIASAPQMYGPMPPEIESFVNQYAPPDPASSVSQQPARASSTQPGPNA